MVQALIQLDENTNRALNVIKARYSLRDKSQAIKFVVGHYIETKEPELRPEFVKKIKLAKKEKSIRVDDFAKRYGI